MHDRQKAPVMRHVAVLIETTGAYGQGLLRGVARYNREKVAWSTYYQPRGIHDPLPPWLKKWRGDGILARVDTREVAEFIGKLGIPVVNLRAILPGLPFPYIGIDHTAVARLAAEHLMARGFRHFGFVGRQRGVHPGLDLRGDCFLELVKTAGTTSARFEVKESGVSGPTASWEQEQDKMARWIAGLPRPLGIMAANDEKGLQVLDACRRGNIKVPDEVAVIGADNDVPMCDLAVPPLTSIDVNSDQIGYNAAALLDQLMDGKKADAAVTLVPPHSVVVRRSTDTTAGDDPDVNEALRFIRDQASSAITLGDVSRHVGISRTLLQARIKKVTGHTIHEEIERIRLARTMELLLMPQLSIKQVAMKAGFSSTQYLTRVFKARLGETPARFRLRRGMSRK
jgi:LacI family transcriptional regulator